MGKSKLLRGAEKFRRNKFVVVVSYLAGACAAGAIARIIQSASGVGISGAENFLYLGIAAFGILFVYYVHRWRV